MKRSHLLYLVKLEKAIGEKLTWEKTIFNPNEYCRLEPDHTIIWMLANLNNALLPLTTSNRSEGDVGYTTMDGDYEWKASHL